MGTNFYARIIPSKKCKKELHDAVDADDFPLIKKLTAEMYGMVEMSYEDNDIIGGVVHLGKRSAGWKFLWNPNVYVVKHHYIQEPNDGSTSIKWVEGPATAEYLYPLTKKGIKDFIDREDVVIYDEYGEKQDKDKFFTEALDWTTWRGKEAYDSDSYHKEHPTETMFICNTELTKLLESLGYTLSKSKSDFYSDGLRFSTSTDFS